MTLDEILKFCKDNPLVLTVPISLLALFFSIKAYLVNRTRLGLDKLKIFTDFNSGYEILKRTQNLFDKLTVKSRNDITSSNLQADLKTLQSLFDDLTKNEDKLKTAYIHTAEIFSLKDRIEGLRKTILKLDFNKPLTFNELMDLKSQYGFIYFELFLMVPFAYPRTYKIDNIEKTKNIRFINQYSELIWGK